MQTPIMEKGSEIEQSGDITARRADSAKRAVASRSITSREEAAMERQIADFQRTFTVRYEW